MKGKRIIGYLGHKIHRGWGYDPAANTRQSAVETHLIAGAITMRSLGEDIRIRRHRDAGTILGVGSHIQLDITNLRLFGDRISRGLFIQALNPAAIVGDEVTILVLTEISSTRGI